MGLFSSSDASNRDDNSQTETLYETLSLAAEEMSDNDFEPDEISHLSPSTHVPINSPLLNTPQLNHAISYGIEDAIALMRRLPEDQSDLVFSVVRDTLESANISIGDIIEDADEKSAIIRDQHQTMEQEIADLRAQINEREDHIDELQQNLDETLLVREKLHLSINTPQTQAETPKPENVPTLEAVRQKPSLHSESVRKNKKIDPSRRRKRHGGNLQH